MTDQEFQRFEALLLAPDPMEMPPRRHRVTQVGDYTRRTTVGIPLLVRWYQTRLLMKEDGEIR